MWQICLWKTLHFYTQQVLKHTSLPLVNLLFIQTCFFWQRKWVVPELKWKYLFFKKAKILSTFFFNSMGVIKLIILNTNEKHGGSNTDDLTQMPKWHDTEMRIFTVCLRQHFKNVQQQWEFHHFELKVSTNSHLPLMRSSSASEHSWEWPIPCRWAWAVHPAQICLHHSFQAQKWQLLLIHYKLWSYYVQGLFCVPRKQFPCPCGLWVSGGDRV